MKMYEIKYADMEGFLNTVTIEAENAAEARKRVKDFDDCEEVVKAKALDQHRKAVVYSVAFVDIDPQDGETPVLKVHHTTLYGVSAESKAAKAKCLADAAKKFPGGYGYYIYNIDNA